MKDRVGAIEGTRCEPLRELRAVPVVGDLAIDEIRELAAVAQVVDDDDVGAAARDSTHGPGCCR